MKIGTVELYLKKVESVDLYIKYALNFIDNWKSNKIDASLGLVHDVVNNVPFLAEWSNRIDCFINSSANGIINLALGA